METPTYIQCPQKFEEEKANGKLIFLAGGISKCPNWQEDFKQMLFESRLPKLVIFNPRRSHDFDFEKESEFQIKWEFDHLKRSDAVSFWFPKESVCPITLLELGTCLKSQNKTVFVGCHPEYSRKTDLYIQTSLYRPEIKIVEDLVSLSQQIQKWYEKPIENKPPAEKEEENQNYYWFGAALFICGLLIGVLSKTAEPRPF